MKRLSSDQITAISGGLPSSYKWAALLVASHVLPTPPVFNAVYNTVSARVFSGLSALNREFQFAYSGSHSWGNALHQTPQKTLSSIDECILKDCKISG